MAPEKDLLHAPCDPCGPCKMERNLWVSASAWVITTPVPRPGVFQRAKSEIGDECLPAQADAAVKTTCLQMFNGAAWLVS